MTDFSSEFDDEEFNADRNQTLFDDGPPNEEEAIQIGALREELSDLLATSPLSEQPENCSDWKLLRFLRGHAGDTGAAAAAFHEMVRFREESGVNELRDKLLSQGRRDPSSLQDYKALTSLVQKGLRYCFPVRFDDNMRLLTFLDVGLLNLRAVLAADLGDMYFEFHLVVEEYTNMILHDLTEARGRLVGRHDIINVSSLGLTQFNKSCLDLIRRVTSCKKYYPEGVAKVRIFGVFFHIYMHTYIFFDRMM